MAKIKDLKNFLEKERESKLSFPEDNDTIEEVVKSHVSFSEPGPEWNSVYCAVCGDGARTKGPRGGWKFENENAFYNCFNCGVKGSFTPEEEYPMSKDMKLIFNSFNIPKRDYAKILFRIRNNNPNFKPLEKPEPKTRISDLIGKGMLHPDYLIPLDKTLDSKIGRECLSLLDDKRIHYKDYPFFVSTGKTDSKLPTDKSNSKATAGRLIIPIYYEDRLLLIQGRDLTGKSKNKYINIGNVSNTVYGIDRLKSEHKYVFVTEGFWDAFHLNGVAVITNNIYSTQIKILNLLEKEKVVAADKGGDHNTLVNRGLKQGWGISVPQELRNVKDVTEAVQKYGKLATAYYYMKAASFGGKATLLSKNF